MVASTALRLIEVTEWFPGLTRFARSPGMTYLSCLSLHRVVEPVERRPPHRRADGRTKEAEMVDRVEAEIAGRDAAVLDGGGAEIVGMARDGLAAHQAVVGEAQHQE